jgi:hypothetical protein
MNPHYEHAQRPLMMALVSASSTHLLSGDDFATFEIAPLSYENYERVKDA